MGSLNKLISSLSKLGVNTTYDKAFVARIILSNRIMLICVALTLPFSFGFYVLNQPLLGLGIMLLCGAYLSCLVLHRYYQHNIAFFLTWALPICGILLYFLVTGTAAGFHFILFFSASLGTILFSREKKVWVVLSMIVPIILFFLCDFFGNDFLIVSLFNPKVLSILRLFAMIITIVCILSVVTIYIDQSIRLLKFRQSKESIVKLKLKMLKEDIESKNNLLKSMESNQAFISATTGVAHEIRSPMASLLAGAELLRDNVDDTTAIKEFSELLINTIQRLKVFTQSILSFGTNTSENKSKFDLSQLINELAALMSYQTKRLGIKLTINQPDSCYITANRDYMAQALLNLIVNATQYTPKKGEIVVSLENQLSGIILQVSDTGFGITKEQIPQVFNSKVTSKKETHNSGLGLALVKRVVEDHDGIIELVSEKNNGTTFTIKLPISS